MTVILEALDGANPLGFLAALGVLAVLDDRGVAVRLSWQEAGAWRPVLHGVDSVDAVLDHLEADLESWREEPVLDLSYRKGKATERDLKPPPEEFARFAESMRALGGRSAALVAAFATDVAVDGNGATKPTALHFTAGQQRFLSMVRDLRDGVGRAHLDEAVVGPWTYTSTLPVMAWDATTDRRYALRATDPSKDKKAGVPGADWLAFIGLQLAPSVPRGSRILTTGATGSWKHGQWTWLLWRHPLGRMAVASLLQQGVSLAAKAPSELAAWGVATVLQSRILRSDQGGRGSFCPPGVLR